MHPLKLLDSSNLRVHSSKIWTVWSSFCYRRNSSFLQTPPDAHGFSFNSWFALLQLALTTASGVNSGMAAHSVNQLAAMLVMPSTQLKQHVTVRNAYMYIYTMDGGKIWCSITAVVLSMHSDYNSNGQLRVLKKHQSQDVFQTVH